MTPAEKVLAISLSSALSLKQLHLFREYGKDLSDVLQMDVDMVRRLGLLKRSRDFEGEKTLTDLARQVIKRCEELSITWIDFNDKRYPSSLRQLFDAPLVLYCRGTVLPFDEMFPRCVAIVGTRKSDDFINQYTKSFALQIGEEGLHVVSGLAEGVDTFAHRGALEAGVPTISVLAGGVNHIYPYGNRDLYQLIIDEGGVILSEHPPDVKPHAYFFPMRNRIIAGLSSCVFLPQAPQKSGAMITVGHALEQGKSIYAFTPPTQSSDRFGGNIDLQNSGAIMVKEAKDFLKDFLLIEEKNPPNFDVELDDEQEMTEDGSLRDEEEIINFLRRFPRTTEEIAAAMGLDVGTVVPLIMELRLRGLVKELPGNRFFVS